MESEFKHRLSKNVLPNHYEIYLSPDLKNNTFIGTVKIFLEVKNPVEDIILNSIDLKIHDVNLTKDGQEFLISKQVEDQDKESLKISFEEELNCGNFTLFIKFSSILNDKLRGFYRSKYLVDSIPKNAAITQFAVADARRCFPCFDEPSFKATFDISLAVPDDLIVLSNMHEIGRKIHPDKDDHIIAQFATSPVMSTYLVAFVVGEFDCVKKVNDESIKVSVYTPLGKSESGTYALDVACKVLSFFAEYFGSNYPLSKLDNIAVPDFLFGAMENWGLITYRESRLLVDPTLSNEKMKQSVALIVGHEIAHQWFGNLVTMSWWTDLWLNEGYATFCQYLSVNELFPEFDVWSQFYKDTFMRAMELDSLRSTHPIEVQIERASQVDEIFDEISYCKGACVIRMIHAYVGDENFRAGMKHYLTKHRYGNASTDDLWDALEESSGKSVRTVMSSWTTQPGFPVLTVSSQQRDKHRVVSISQQRFVLEENKTRCDSGLEWVVPITVSTCKFARREFLLEGSSDQIILKKVPSDSWVKINVDAIGFYRVNYSEEMLSDLLQCVKSNFFTPIDRLSIIDDLFTMAKAGYSSTVTFLKALESFKEEDNYSVLSGICHSLEQLSRLLAYSSSRDSFANFVRNFLSKLFSRVEWQARPEEKKTDCFLRSLLIGFLGTHDDWSVRKRCKKLFANHVSGSTPLSSDLQEHIYKVIMSLNCEHDLDLLIQIYEETEVQTEKVKILTSLGTSTDPNLIQKILQFAVSDKVRSQDSAFVLMSLAQTREGRNAAWNYYKNNINFFKNRYEGMAIHSRLVKNLTSHFASLEMAGEVRSFLSDHVTGVARAADQAAENIRINATWLKRDQEEIEKFLTQAAS